MDIIHRQIDLNTDKTYILDKHCFTNYTCRCKWEENITYDEYRKSWYSMPVQMEEFLSAINDSIDDLRAVTEILETAEGERIGYLWVSFCEDLESGFCFADMQDIYIEDAFRNQGIANMLVEYVEKKAKANGAKVIRSGTGYDNIASRGLHDKRGYYQYRYEYEKIL